MCRRKCQISYLFNIPVEKYFLLDIPRSSRYMIIVLFNFRQYQDATRKCTHGCFRLAAKCF